MDKIFKIAKGFMREVMRYIGCKVGYYGRFTSLDSYAHNNSSHIEFLFKSKEKTIYAEPQNDVNYFGVLKQGPEIESFLILLKNASCFAFSDIILLDNGRYFCEIKDNRIIGPTADCTDHRVLIEDNKFYYRTTNISSFRCEFVKSGIFFSGLFSWNYYHFTYQVLPRLRWIEDIESDVPLLIDRTCLETNSFYSLLRLLAHGRQNFFIMEEKQRYLVGDLYYVSAQTYLQPNHKSGTPYPKLRCFYKVSTLSYLHDSIIHLADNSKEYPKRVFLGRKYVTSGRRLFNEEECVECAKEYGFEVVYPEFMTIGEQVGLFNSADVIIGGSGAAFTNLVYCSVGVKVVVFSKYRSQSGLWQTIVEYNGGKLMYLSETEEVNMSPEKAHAPFYIEIDKLKQKLDELL